MPGSDDKRPFVPLKIAVLTISDTRELDDDKSGATLIERLKSMSDADLNKTVKFFTAPKQMGDVRKMDVLWFMMMDCVHHRGQMSVYLRMADGKVPSIYGPSADEPWM